MTPYKHGSLSTGTTFVTHVHYRMSDIDLIDIEMGVEGRAALLAPDLVLSMGHRRGVCLALVGYEVDADVLRVHAIVQGVAPDVLLNAASMQRAHVPG